MKKFKYISFFFIFIFLYSVYTIPNAISYSSTITLTAETKINFGFEIGSDDSDYERFRVTYPKYFENGTIILSQSLKSIDFQIKYSYYSYVSNSILYKGPAYWYKSQDVFHPYMRYYLRYYENNSFKEINVDQIYNVYSSNETTRLTSPIWNFAVPDSPVYAQDIGIFIDSTYSDTTYEYLSYAVFCEYNATFDIVWSGGGMNELMSEAISFLADFIIYIVIIYVFMRKFKTIGLIMGMIIGVLIAAIADAPIGLIIFEIVITVLIIAIYYKKYLHKSSFSE